MRERGMLLLPIADDELVLGWRNSEWTGIAPFSRRTSPSRRSRRTRSATRALYELVAEEVGTADELAFDRSPPEYRHSRLRRAPARTRLGADARAARPLRGGGRRGGSRREGVGRWRRGRPGGEDRPEEACGSTRRCGSTAWPASRASPRHSTSFGPCSRSAAGPARSSAPLGGDDDGAPLGRGCDMVTAEQVWDALAEIPDPEIPDLSRRPRRCARRGRGGRPGAGRVHADVSRLSGARGHARPDGDEGARARRRAGGGGDLGRLVVDRPHHARGTRETASSRLPPPAPREPGGPQLVQLQSARSAAPTAARRTRSSRTSSARRRAARCYCNGCRQPFEQFKTI